MRAVLSYVNRNGNDILTYISVFRNSNSAIYSLRSHVDNVPRSQNLANDSSLHNGSQ